MDQLRLLVLDVDGVLTDGRLWWGDLSEPQRAFHIHDGLGIKLFREAVGEVAILTAKRSQAVTNRAAELGLTHVIQGSGDKLADLNDLLATLNLQLEQVAMMGDDLQDLQVLLNCGYPLAPANAVAEVRAAARYVTKARGGHGAVREAIEHILRERGDWERILARYQSGQPVRS